MSAYRHWIVAALAFVSSAAVAQAQDDPSRHSFSLTPYAQYQFNSNYDEARVHIAREGVDFDYNFSLNQRTQLSVGLKYEDSVYDWNDFRKVSPGVTTPVDHVGMVRVSPGAAFAITDRWSVRGAVLGQIAGEYGTDFADSTTYGFVGLVMYKVNSRLLIGGGAVYYTKLEDDAGLVPIGALEFAITDQLHLSGRGTELRLTYYTRPEVNVYVAGSYDTREYRLGDSAPYRAGVLTDDVIPVRLGMEWQPAKQFKISGEIGVTAWQELTFDDSDGHRIVKDKVDPTGFLALQFTYSF